jgi:GMP synthase (glutamine-hydrolysing)
MREQLGLNVVAVDASERFLSKLAGVTDPEKKRKAIGNEFIAVFDDEAKKIFEAEKARVKRLRGWCRGRCIRM